MYLCSEPLREIVKRPPARADDFGGLHKAAGETRRRMGITQPNGEAFRLKTSR
ncbi:TPA: PerC family transcriptional regulator [Klebsiella pneumoniae]|uniref:PerC family transcriptional regulator n=1 Tax=Klebsiella pneumoniae TaxID=573 RepID=UPI000E3517D2|nr:PerC family transcriptional regulator [Klebsiella pneumoniae]EMA8104429.1 PerC family transcriptional regulator [Klebsiella quasipneumoniae]QGA04418.1 PerC family transcriptional regulator [Klebsiella pneumoniae]HBQ6445818.1 PerC family transcriptional regulator [Klebsiella pneumoniae]HBR4420708.1 PerC family transcriptional regulator [Klebsiella pneumoniae]